jgi:predicted nucleotidyltransferase
MNRDAVLEALRRAAPELRARYGVVSALLFGSVARGDADSLSDIDVAVRFEEDRPTDVMALCGVSGLLSALFDAEVDVIALPTRNPALGEAVRREAAIAF